MTQWSSRSRRTWTMDMNHMEKRYRIRISHDAAKTDEVNRRLVADATHCGGRRAMTTNDVMRTMFGNAFR